MGVKDGSMNFLMLGENDLNMIKEPKSKFTTSAQTVFECEGPSA